MMRTRHLVAGLLAVMLAACSSGTSTAPSAAPSVEPTLQPTPTTAATPEPTASPAPAATTPGLSVKVTFDGETCSYVGPTVIPDGTTLRFEYAPDQEVRGSYLIVYGVKPGTTLDMASPDGSSLVTDAPDWVLQMTAAYIHGAGTLLYTVRSVQQGSDDVDYPVGGYQVACDTPYMFFAAQLTVAGA